MAQVAQSIDEQIEGWRQTLRRDRSGGCLWPPRYAPPLGEGMGLPSGAQEIARRSFPAAYRFITERCYTWDDEAPQALSTIPDMEYVERIVSVWLYAAALGKPLIIEKSRRLIVSWILRGLELWALGCRKETHVIAGLTYAKANEHAWRVAWLYRQLLREHPEMNLEDCLPLGGNYSRQQNETVILPNGSIVDGLNQQSGTFQGSGKTRITMEEFSMYDDPLGMFAQALTITGGRADIVGGSVVIVTNADPNPEWRELKKPMTILYNSDSTWNPL